MVGIISLIIGILGFVKRRINVTKTRELRGAGMYVVATLFCLPFPLSFLLGVIIGASQVAGGKPVDQSSLLVLASVCTWVPILLAVILAFVMAKPKEAPEGSGFPVSMPPAPAAPPTAPLPNSMPPR